MRKVRNQIGKNFPFATYELHSTQKNIIKAKEKTSCAVTLYEQRHNFRSV